MGQDLRIAQQWVTVIVPGAYAVIGLFLFSLYRHWSFLFVPLGLLLLNPVLPLYARLRSEWKVRFIYEYAVILWMASVAMTSLSGKGRSMLYPGAFFMPLGYVALFLGRRSVAILSGMSVVAAFILYALTGMAESQGILGSGVILGNMASFSIDLILFIFVVSICRVLNRWMRDAKQHRLLSFDKGDRNNPQNQLRLNRMFGGIFFMLHAIQGADIALGKKGGSPLLFLGLTLFGWVLWMGMSYAIFVDPGYALQPMITLGLLVFCTASIAVSGFAESGLYPGLYVLPITFMSFTTSRKVATGAGLLSLLLSLLLLWATPEKQMEHVFRFLMHGMLFIALPQVIGYIIRVQMRTLKQRASYDGVE